MKDHYQLLDVRPDAGSAEIRSKLDAEEKKWFYRRNSAPNPDKREEAERIARDLEEARRVLLDAQLRADYDRDLGVARQLPPPTPYVRNTAIPPPHLNRQPPPQYLPPATSGPVPAPLDQPTPTQPPNYAPMPTHVPYQGYGSGLRVSSKGRRLGAYLMEGLLFFATLGIGYLIWLLVTMTEGQTPGKKVLGMVTVDANTGAPASFGVMFTREILIKAILVGIIGTVFPPLVIPILLWILWDASNQMLWDKMVSTLVVDVN